MARFAVVSSSERKAHQDKKFVLSSSQKKIVNSLEAKYHVDLEKFSRDEVVIKFVTTGHHVREAYEYSDLDSEFENNLESAILRHSDIILPLIDRLKKREPSIHAFGELLREEGASEVSIAQVSHLLEYFLELQNLELRPKPPIEEFSLEISSLPDHAPAIWKVDQEPGDTPPAFIKRHYEPWLGKGLTRADIKKFDPQLYDALTHWLRSNKLPKGFGLDNAKRGKKVEGVHTSTWVERIRQADRDGTTTPIEVNTKVINRLAKALLREKDTGQELT